MIVDWHKQVVRCFSPFNITLSMDISIKVLNNDLVNEAILS